MPGARVGSVEWPIQIQGKGVERKMKRVITEKEIESKRTPNGGFTKRQLAEWGVPWPKGGNPPKGWRKQLLRDGIEDRHEELDRECDNARDRDQTGDEKWLSKK
jgi:hypothetical protein